MKAISICFLLSLYFNGNIVGQEPLPVEKKTYRDKHGNLYVNRKLPIYLQLSNDSSKKAENYLLKSHNTPEHTNPMFFYKEGYNAIRLGQAEDATTNKNVYSREPIEFEVYADSKSPSTEAVGSSSPMVIKRGKTYYGRNFSIRLKGLDNLSGIENIYYSINGRPFQIYSTPIKFEKDKKYTLKYYAADNVGNVEAVKSRSFSIDKSAPVSGFGFKGHKIGDVVSPNAFIVLSSQDSLSGVKHIYYSINSGPEKIYKHPIPVRHFKGGGGYVIYYAVDHVRNLEEPRILRAGSLKTALNTSEKCDFQVDNTPPELRVRIQGNSYKGKYLFVSPDSKIELSALDGQSGVKTINYSINSNSLHNTYVKPFSLKDNKRHFLYYAAEDSMGNRTPRQRATIFVDKYLPNSHVYLSGPQHHRKDTLIISRETKIKFSGRDGESGVKEIVYKINSSKEMTYSQEFSLHDEGVNKLAFAAVDQVLNREWYNVKTVFLDTTPPVIHLQFNKDYIGSKTVRGKHYTIYPKNTLIFLNPTDNLSGTKKVEYTINGGPVKSTMPISGFHPGNYEIQYSALDAVNNKTELKKMEFSIE